MFDMSVVTDALAAAVLAVAAVGMAYVLVAMLYGIYRNIRDCL